MAEAVSCERYKSPDGALELLVESYDDDDTALGFAGFPWHTHPEVIAAEYDVNASEAVQDFLARLFQNRSVIAILQRHGRPSDVWVAPDPQVERARFERSKAPGEELVLRYWSQYA